MTDSIAKANTFVNLALESDADNSVCRNYRLPVATIGDRIEELKTRKGFSSLAQLAEACGGLPRQTLSHIVRESRRNPAFRPDLSTLAKVADGTGVTVAWLLGEAATEVDVTEERVHDASTSEFEAPRLMNLPGWPDLVATAQALDEARGVPQWAFDLLGWSNGLVTVPLVPSSIVELAKLVMKYTSPADAEAALSKLRSATNRP